MEKTLSQKTVHWQAAGAACQAAQEKAQELGIVVSVVVMDRGGNVIASLRDPRTPFHTYGIASDKATTAAGFGMPTSQWWGFLESMDSPGVKAGLPATDRLAVFGGGVPIYDGPELVGGIGVSGGSEEQDEVCARAGLAAAQLAGEPG